MRLLYCGDSRIPGAANYLTGVLKLLKVNVSHVPPGDRLTPSVFRKRFDAIVLSDFGRIDMPSRAERKIVTRVREGAGFLMVGGWASFSGPFGRWKGSAIERLLPVSCLGGDDRRNVSGGLLMHKVRAHAITKDIRFRPSPVLCGLNEFRLKNTGLMLLSAREIVHRSGGNEYGLSLRGRSYPLLVIDRNRKKRIAAFATDVAPHWCGGMVDWGARRRELVVTKNISIEVGDMYIRFVSSLVKWLLRS